MAVKLELSATKSAIKQLQRFDKILFQGAEETKRVVMDNWDSARGADGKKMPALTDKYKKIKAKDSKTPIRDLSYKTGQLRSGFKVFDKSFSRKILTFVPDQIKKARGNVKYAKNMMTVSERLERDIIKFVNKLFWKKIK